MHNFNVTLLCSVHLFHHMHLCWAEAYFHLTYTTLSSSNFFCFSSLSCSCSPFIFTFLKSPIKESIGWCLPPPPSSILQCVSVWVQITIRLVISESFEWWRKRQRKRGRESMISDGGGGGSANDFHLIAPPPLLESGEGWREEDKRGTREWKKESANDDKPFSL